MLLGLDNCPSKIGHPSWLALDPQTHRDYSETEKRVTLSQKLHAPCIADNWLCLLAARQHKCTENGEGCCIYSFDKAAWDVVYRLPGHTTGDFI